MEKDIIVIKEENRKCNGSICACINYACATVTNMLIIFIMIALSRRMCLYELFSAEVIIFSVNTSQTVNT